MKYLFLLLSIQLFAADTQPSLEEQLGSLSVPRNQIPGSVPSENVYAVQSRLSPLKFRHEFSFSGAKNFTAASYIDSNNLDLTYRFYLSDRWYVGLAGSIVFNNLSEAGQKLLAMNEVITDAAFAKYRFDLLVGYHLFYGKFRVSLDQVFYFDQYWALGGGYMVLSQNNSFAGVGDVGMAFWFGRHLSFRFGAKHFLFHEQRIKSQGLAYSLLGHADIGYIF
jgi:hypothetical protein